VLRLAAVDTAAALDAADAAARTLDQAREVAARACAAAIAAVPADDKDAKKPLRRLLERLRAGRPLQSVGAGVSDALVKALDHVAADERTFAACSAAVDAAYQRDRRAIAASLRELAADPHLREAIVWQNRPLVERVLDPLARTPVDATDAATRQREITLASYAQRYAVKNDTVGFFGPTGWATVVDDPCVVRISPGERLLGYRRVFLEYWCVDAIAAALSADPQLRADLCPRRLPTVRLDGATLHYRIAKSSRLPDEYAALVARCDGTRSAISIAEELAADARVGVTAEEVMRMLDELVQQQVVRWAIELPTGGQHSERQLRAAVERLPESPARARALVAVAELEARRDAVANAAGDAGAVDRELRAFEEMFTRMTGLPPTRRAGETYAGRGLLYEDTRRDVRVELGRGFIDRLGPPLSLVMVAARWYTHELAGAYRAALTELYRELREQTGNAVVDYQQFVARALPLFTDQYKFAPIVRRVLDQLHERWMLILRFEPGARRIQHVSAKIADEVAAAFSAPQPGWPQAREHSPDVMVIARDTEAFARGELSFVINEIHAGCHSYIQPAFLNMPEDPDSLLRGRAHDVGRPIIETVEPRATTVCTDHVSLDPEDLDIEASDALSWRPRSHVIEAAELAVVDNGGVIVVRTLDGTRTFDLVQVFEGYLLAGSVAHFRLLPRIPHTPRITIDDLVVARETWSFAPDELAFTAATGLERFVQARRWAREHRLPRFVFVRLPPEAKPHFVDLASPHSIDLFARHVRTAQSVEVSEILPAIDETWLQDNAGNSYTAEIRVALRDPRAWEPDITSSAAP
jgi:hypothetical protein